MSVVGDKMRCPPAGRTGALSLMLWARPASGGLACRTWPGMAPAFLGVSGKGRSFPCA
jgi:hypothetical protein